MSTSLWGLKISFRMTKYVYGQLICHSQGQARGYGHITSFACRPHGANTSNFNNSLTAQYFWELLSAYENLGYLWLFPVGFKNFHQIVFKWEQFEKKVFKNLFSARCEKFSFSEKCQKVLDFDNALWPNHSTHNKAKGIYGKMISISFIWHPRVWNMPTGWVTMAQGKSWPHVGRGKKWVIRPYPLACPCLTWELIKG